MLLYLKGLVDWKRASGGAAYTDTVAQATLKVHGAGYKFPQEG